MQPFAPVELPRLHHLSKAYFFHEKLQKSCSAYELSIHKNAIMHANENLIITCKCYQTLKSKHSTSSIFEPTKT